MVIVPIKAHYRVNLSLEKSTSFRSLEEFAKLLKSYDKLQSDWSYIKRWHSQTMQNESFRSFEFHSKCTNTTKAIVFVYLFTFYSVDRIGCILRPYNADLLSNRPTTDRSIDRSIDGSFRCYLISRYCGAHIPTFRWMYEMIRIGIVERGQFIIGSFIWERFSDVPGGT